MNLCDTLSLEKVDPIALSSSGLANNSGMDVYSLFFQLSLLNWLVYGNIES